MAVKPINVKNPSKTRTVTIGKYILAPGQSRYIQFESLEEMYLAIRLQEQNLLTIETELSPDILEGNTGTGNSGGGTNDGTSEGTTGGGLATNKYFRDDFVGSELDSNYWEIVNDTGGFTLNISNSELIITSPRTANEQFILRTKQLFTIPAMFNIDWHETSRTPGVERFFEFISEDGQDGIGVWYHGNGGTSGIRVFGTFHGEYRDSASLLYTYPTTNNRIHCVEVHPDYMRLYNRSTFKANNDYISNDEYWLSKLPDPNKKYYFQIRMETSAAPSTPTTFRSNFLHLNDIGQMVSIETHSDRGGNLSTWAPPVNIANTPNVTLSGGTSIADTSHNTSYQNVGPLIAGAQWTSNSFYHNHKPSLYLALYTDADCTLVVEAQVPIINKYIEHERFNVSANTLEKFRVFAFTTYQRVRVIMGANPCTFCYLMYVPSASSV